MRVLPALLALLLPLSSIPGFADEGFYHQDALPQENRPADYENAFRSVYKLKGPIMGEGLVCSATAVSNDGYMLTNLHCVPGCLSGAAVVGFSEEDNGGYIIRKVRNQHPDLSCPDVYIDNLMSGGDSVYLRNPKVVWISRGKVTIQDDRKVQDLPPDVYRQALEYQDDFVVLKYELPKPVSCIPVEEKRPEPGSRVWSIGYPRKTTRPEGSNADGSSQYTSEGRVAAGVQDGPWLRRNLSAEGLRREEAIFNNPSLLLTTVDGIAGFSGSPLFDQAGKLVGQGSTSLIPPDENAKAYPASIYLGNSIGHIIDEVTAGLGAAKAQEIFNCRPLPEAPPARHVKMGAVVPDFQSLGGSAINNFDGLR